MVIFEQAQPDRRRQISAFPSPQPRALHHQESGNTPQTHSIHSTFLFSISYSCIKSHSPIHTEGHKRILKSLHRQ